MTKDHSPNNCPVCSSEKVVYKPHTTFTHSLWRCRSCGLIFVYPQPTLQTLEKIYGDAYFKNEQSQDYGYDDYQKDKTNILKTSERRLRSIEAFMPKKGMLLDVGCALGYFVEAAVRRGWDAHGIDISRYAIDAAKQTLGDRVMRGVLADANFPKGKFDAVVSWDCIEHVPDPRAQLKQTAELLKPGGLLVMATPDAGSAVAKLMGDRWMGYKDLEHLFYFSRRSLRMLLEQSGFEVIKFRSTGKYVSLDLFTRRLALYSKKLSKMIATVSKRYDPALINFYVDPLDIMMVYARKKADEERG